MAAKAAAAHPNSSVMPITKDLQLARRRLGLDEIIALADKLRHNAEPAEKLNLYDCHLSAAGVKVIASALRDNNSLRVLNLGGNVGLGDKGAADIAVALCENTTLLEIHLVGCCISSVGATSLAEALLCNSSVKKINLNSNFVEDTGAEALAQALVQNEACSLTSLKLRFNKVGAKGAAALAKALRHPSMSYRLEELDLGYNKIAEAEADDLADALERNCTLTSFDLRGNDRIVWKEPAINAKIRKSVKKNQDEMLLQMIYTRIDNMPSLHPFILFRAIENCGLRGIYRLLRERPDLIER